jgi:hypothetical protein
MSYPDIWPGRCTVNGCTKMAGVAATFDYGQRRWARCNDHLDCDDDGKPMEPSGDHP